MPALEDPWPVLSLHSAILQHCNVASGGDYFIQPVVHTVYFQATTMFENPK